ncbi:MAG: type IV secretion system DNA-binding domain-containing protein [Clostridia bacterium]|nr:type IV secretion system DNA-binding domain-containing protein [Clostridia bacterium]
MYQNILVTGTIGSGKTSSIMYPLTRQLINYKSTIENEKISMLILDVKGNYYEQVINFASEAGRLSDVIVIDLSGSTTYNPLDKPSLSPIVLANRLKTILTLFSPNNQESYWLDKSEQFLAECIKFCRLYNDGYVTFSEIHKLVLLKDYYLEKLNLTKKYFLENKYNKNQVYDLLTCIDFFEKEIFSLDERTLAILRSEISRITNIFISDYNVSRVFCPQKSDITFSGFDYAIKNGKIVVLNLNIAEFRNLSKILASYLKLDFQTEVLSQMKHTPLIRKTAFISDEYHEYVTQTDSDFFAESREAKCINIVATQSYSSIRKTLHDDLSSNVIIQGLVNKLWFRTDDNYTIEEIQKQLGKEEKEKTSRTISENARETKYNLAINSLLSSGSSISESINVYSQNDYIYDTNFFSQKLQTFNCLAFISDGMKVQKPREITTIPYYLQKGV